MVLAFSSDRKSGTAVLSLADCKLAWAGRGRHLVSWPNWDQSLVRAMVAKDRRIILIMLRNFFFLAFVFLTPSSVISETVQERDVHLTERSTSKFVPVLSELEQLEGEGRFVEAIELVDETMASSFINGPMWQKLQTKRAKLRAQLDFSLAIAQADVLLEQKKVAEAREQIVDLANADLGQFNYEKLAGVLDRAQKNQPTTWERVKIILLEIRFYSLLSVFALISVLLLRKFLNLLTGVLSPRWQLGGIEDSTSRSVKDVLANSFDEWKLAKRPSTLSGLLMLEATDIPPAPNLSTSENNSLFSEEITASEFQVGGVSVGALSKLFEDVRKWFWPRTREIRGVAYVGADGNLCIRLTAECPEQKKNIEVSDEDELSSSSANSFRKSRTITVSAVADGIDERAVQIAANEVAYKMLYALTTGSAQKVSDVNEFRTGLKLLHDYLSASPRQDGTDHWNDLSGAKEIFERIRKTRPNNLEAHLYEGIALDLMERHEDAAAHFDHVKLLTDKSRKKDEKRLNSLAAYNGAVAHLRNLYGLEPIDEAVKRLDEIIKSEPEAKRSALAALAMATKADAYSNRTIHWQNVDERELSLAPDSTNKQRLEKVIELHQKKVTELIDPLQSLVDALNSSSQSKKEIANWNTNEARQIQWAINNAQADFYLYAATAMLKVDVSNFSGYSEYSEARNDPNFYKFIEEALNFLRQCEMLLPAGVETLSNIGTLYLVRGHSGDLPIARRYLDRAIRLNPYYEYAHYRLALTWQAEGWREMVIAALEECPVPPQIPQFSKLFRDYYVRPKSRYEIIEDSNVKFATSADSEDPEDNSSECNTVEDG